MPFLHSARGGAHIVWQAQRKDCLLYTSRAIAPADWEALTVPVEGCALLTNPINPGVKEPALWTCLLYTSRCV